MVLGVLALLLVFTAKARTADQTFIAAGSVWKYNDTGSNLSTDWTAPAYNDTGWSTGAAELWYGDGGEATLLSYGGNTSNRYITSYFRRSFTVANPALLAALTVRFIRDDGAVMYVNGVEVLRSNTPAVTFSATGSAPAGLVSATLYVSGPPHTAVFSGPAQVEDTQITADTPTSPMGTACR